MGYDMKKGMTRTAKHKSEEIKPKVFQAIRADIISQHLKPGQAIHEDELASQYGISRTPIREILRMLEHEDLVRIVPHSGAVVAELTANDIAEVLEIRMWLEPAAARSAAVKATDGQIAEFKSIGRQLDVALEKLDSLLSFDADGKLHNLILIAAGNRRSRRIINNLMGQIHRIRFISGHKPGRIETTVREHKQIVEAIIKRLPEKAEEAMRIHIVNTRDLLLPSSEMEERFENLLRDSLLSHPGHS